MAKKKKTALPVLPSGPLIWVDRTEDTGRVGGMIRVADSFLPIVAVLSDRLTERLGEEIGLSGTVMAIWLYGCEMNEFPIELAPDEDDVLEFAKLLEPYARSVPKGVRNVPLKAEPSRSAWGNYLSPEKLSRVG